MFEDVSSKRLINELFFLMMFLVSSLVSKHEVSVKDILGDRFVPNQVSPSPFSQSTSFTPTANAVSGQVKKVVDGDTVTVIIGNSKKTVRLIGIDTPETVDPRKPVQCFGKEASNRAKELLTGKQVRLESDSSQQDVDKYGRLLRYIWLENGKNFNLEMISEGYAFEYTYDLPYKYQQAFKKAQNQAQLAKRGLWSNDTCEGIKK